MGYLYFYMYVYLVINRMFENKFINILYKI